LIDSDVFNVDSEERNLDAMDGDDDIDSIGDNDMKVVEGNTDDSIGSDADSKSNLLQEELESVTILSREQCENNDILKVQEILLSRLYDQRAAPTKFNKVNQGKEVDKIAALKILQYIEEHHLSISEANEYLKFNHEIVELVTGKPFNMVKSYKTLTN